MQNRGTLAATLARKTFELAPEQLGVAQLNLQSKHRTTSISATTGRDFASAFAVAQSGGLGPTPVHMDERARATTGPAGGPKRDAAASADAADRETTTGEFTRVKPVLQEIWARMRDKLRSEYGEDVFDCWLKSLTMAEQRGATVRLAAPSLIIRDFIEQNFGARIGEEWRAAEQGIEAVEIIVKPNGRAAAISPSAARPSKPAAPDETPAPLDERYTFERFVAGASNEVALRAALKVGESDRVAFNPLYLYGGVGLGKTHLLQAIGWRMRARHPQRRILYLTADRFRSLFQSALQERRMVEFKEQYRSVDLLLIDDLQFVCRPGATQEEFFHTLNALTDNARQVVAAADRAPSALEGMSDGLRSRLSGGLSVEVHGTDPALRLAIVTAKAAQLKLEADPRALELLAHRVDSNVRELEGALNSIYWHCEHAKCELTLDIAEKVLRSMVRDVERKLGIEEIQKKVAEHFKIRVAEMRSARRSLGVVRPRQVAMYLSKQLTTRSLPEIGRMFGGRDHTTVLHAVRRVEELTALDPVLRGDVDLLRRILEN
jgi:chromosomal replication initiator protein